ncbi:DUF2798 domain-containing protein [Anaerotignum lactatifermentans]|uniref:DUF2798 domain-containing protein n=1 Tax=Anaerotignum lactatifermentans TaxID=160404 RepID=A0ABS2G6T2_9FIRM|nr:DUF2798 domain-containing protein [Anaerotignum lactatifermentans]MBM6829755.1 DUF2798 domain-containing protein [Anaerotignum lactatifermentans]MBM6877176.1 DUF2798 domain-containing protein [Anaerotignum lactatifermentans]MBM6951414.1 DUF2798 domain-containing protein [Anaerotignum lactatifermentans]
MPKNKRESLIYTVLMCFCMVIWMSMYHAVLHNGWNMEALRSGWMGFPLAYICAMCLDLFLVSRIAKGITFRYLVKPDSSVLRKVISISGCMVVFMVLFMSLYGALEVCVRTGAWNSLFFLWLKNLPVNFVMALPFQLLVAGPVVRRVFRMAFPEGTVLG